MIPRIDRETYPATAGSVQVIKRKTTDQYGNELAGRRGYLEKRRALQTRNGLPVRLYVYRGTGESLTENEAEWWLRTTFSKVKDCTTCDLLRC